MDEIVWEAAGALEPLALAGAGAVATGFAERVGAEFYELGHRLLTKIRDLIKGSDERDRRDQLADALLRGLEQARITEDDLVRLVGLARRGAEQGNQTQIHNLMSGDVRAANMLIGNQIQAHEFKMDGSGT